MSNSSITYQVLWKTKCALETFAKDDYNNIHLAIDDSVLISQFSYFLNKLYYLLQQRNMRWLHVQQTQRNLTNLFSCDLELKEKNDDYFIQWEEE